MKSRSRIAKRKYVISPKIWKLNFASAKIAKKIHCVETTESDSEMVSISKRKLSYRKYVFY